MQPRINSLKSWIIEPHTMGVPMAIDVVHGFHNIFIFQWHQKRVQTIPPKPFALAAGWRVSFLL